MITQNHIFKLLEPNATAPVVAEKNNLPLPKEVDDAYTTLNKALTTVNKIDLPNVHKTAHVAVAAEKAHKTLLEAVDKYETNIQTQASSFEKDIDDIIKPDNQLEAVEFSNWTNTMIHTTDNVYQLALSDPTLARVALRIPTGIQKVIKMPLTPKKTDALKEVVFPGYTAEKGRYETLLDNVSTTRVHAREQFGQHYGTPQTKLAIASVKELNAL